MTATQQILTANHLLRGDVIYWSGTDWTPEVSCAQPLQEPEAALQQALADPLVVGPYLAEITANTAPVHFREKFRATGPSNYPHGKQEARA